MNLQSIARLLAAIVVALAGSHVTAQSPVAAGSPKPMLDALSWMTGAWSGAAGTATVEEHWIAPAGKMMLAVGRVTRADRTLVFEFLRIEERAEGIFYVAQPNGQPPTEFKLTKLDGQSVVFENPQHDNPKIIRYRRDGDGMVAETEGDEKGKPVTQRFSYAKK
jgi:Domain of unknown function (DUF6265)